MAALAKAAIFAGITITAVPPSPAPSVPSTVTLTHQQMMVIADTIDRLRNELDQSDKAMLFWYRKATACESKVMI